MNTREYYLNKAKELARKGNCKRRNYGCVIIHKRPEFILARGYTYIDKNAKCITDIWPREANNINHNSGDYSECKSIHAELMALLYRNNDPSYSCEGSTIYLVGIDKDGNIIEDSQPCPNCRKHLKYMGVTKLINYAGEFTL